MYNALIELYAMNVINGEKNIEDVPKVIREQVQALVAEKIKR